MPLGQPPTAWDARAVVRTAALSAVLFAVACLVTAATDEGGVAWAARLGRTLPLLPACGAAATFLSLRIAARRGEMLALETLGCTPARIGLASVLGGGSASAVAFVVLLALPAPRSSQAVAAFFPRIGGSPVLVESAPGGASSGAPPTFLDAARHVRITAAGVVSSASPSPSPSPSSSPAPSSGGAESGGAESGGAESPASARLSVALVLLAAGAGLPLVAARRVRDPRAGPWLAAAVMCVLCILAFHFAAAGRASPLLACIPACALLIGALVRYRRPSWA